jgi:hypothetical protein
MAVSLAVDSSRVVHETIDDETILINLRTGTYYSLTGSGSEVWGLLSAGIPVDQAAGILRERYPANGTEAEQAVRKLADQLVEEELLVGTANGRGPDEIPPPEPRGGAFEAPALQRFTDMEYFLLLDPVHEVDDSAGWPGPAREDED